MEAIWSEKDIKKVKRYLKSKKGIARMKEINEHFEKLEREEEQEDRDNIVWWHKIKDIPFTI